MLLLASSVCGLFQWRLFEPEMNWNNTQFDSLTPITVKAARDVGKMLKYLTAENEPVQDSYRFYM